MLCAEDSVVNKTHASCSPTTYSVGHALSTLGNSAPEGQELVLRGKTKKLNLTMSDGPPKDHSM